jgi:hypothetical protein
MLLASQVDFGKESAAPGTGTLLSHSLTFISRFDRAPMFAILSLLLVLTVSLLVTRIAAVALVHTGMTRESARFQARSAFTGAGFTTSEAEDVVAHPVRRRIVMWLMLSGNVGMVTVVSSLLISLIDIQSSDAVWSGIAILTGGVVALWLLASSAWVDRRLCSAISWALRRFTSLDTRDYARLLHVRDDYGVTEVVVAEGDWVAGRVVGEAGLDLEGIRVLGIECPGGYFLGAPDSDVAIRAGDRLVLYGRGSRIAEVDSRGVGPRGEAMHAQGVLDQQRLGSAEREAARR